MKAIVLLLGMCLVPKLWSAECGTPAEAFASAEKVFLGVVSTPKADKVTTFRVVLSWKQSKKEESVSNVPRRYEEGEEVIVYVLPGGDACRMVALMGAEADIDFLKKKQVQMK
jgi:hypothetical protein